MLLIFFCYLLFAAGIFANKLIMATLSPTMLSGLRMSISGLILLILSGRSLWSKAGTIWEHARTLVGIAVFTHFIPTVCKAYAVKNMSVAKAGMLGSIDPFVTALYAYVLFSEHLTFKKWLGIVLGVLGTLVLTTISSPVEATLKTFAVFSLPELAALTAVFAGRLGWLMIQKEARSEVFSSAELSGLTMTIGGCCSFLSMGMLQLFGSGERFGAAIAAIDMRVGLLLAFTIVVGNLGAYNLLTHLLRNNSITLMSIAGFTVPLNLAVLGYFVLGEPIFVEHVVAAVLMLVAVFTFYYDDFVRDIRLRHQG